MRKKVDGRIRTLVENGIKTHTRSMFVIVGDRGRDQVVNLHFMMHKIANTKPSVLWCYKKELGFSTHRKKRMKQAELFKDASVKLCLPTVSDINPALP
eukprot:s1167_g3.t1